MYRILCIYVLCFILSSCFVANKITSPATSEVSSISIEKPSGLPQSYANDGGYSLCIERVNHAEGGCSNSILKENSWSKNSTIDYDLKNDCPSGYKLKMWLWESEGNKTGNNIYVLSRVGKEEVKDGYISIPKSQLTGGTINLNLAFKRLTDGSTVVSEGDPKEVSVDIVPYIDDSSSGSSESGSGSGSGSSGTSGSSGKFDCGCDTKDTSTSSGGKKEGGGSSGGEPSGTLEEIANINEVKRGYPALVVYSSYRNCEYCKKEKKEFLSTQIGPLKGKMYVYYVDLDKHNVSFTCNGDSRIPQNHFFKSDGTLDKCFVGYSEQQLKQKIKELTGFSL